jgi:hypothetical protein
LPKKDVDVISKGDFNYVYGDLIAPNGDKMLAALD